MRFLLTFALCWTLSSLVDGSPQIRRVEVVSAKDVQARAALEADAAASDLEAIATRMEALAKDMTKAAREARSRAILARRRANDARKEAGILGKVEKGELGAVPGSILRAAEERESQRAEQNQGAGENQGDDQRESQQGGQRGGQRGGLRESQRKSPRELQPDSGLGGDVRLRQAQEQPQAKAIPIERDKHAAAGRTAEENKAAYFGFLRPRHDANRKETQRQTFTFSPGEAPDMADIEIRAKWQWGINVARGGDSFQGAGAQRLNKTGHVDLARLLVRPDSETADHGGMKWGLRRYNLGDSTVVDCDFDAIPLEHGIYDNLSGHGLYSGNTFRHLGGQAIQIAHRDLAYEQYEADNLPFRGKPVLIVENCHAVDCGRHASKSGFTWTFFDYGTHEHPSTIVLRNCTSVHAWDFTRTLGGEAVKANHPSAIRSPGGLVVHQYQHAKGDQVGQEKGYAVENLVIDNCLFDHTQGGNPIAAVRGTETILVEDSCFMGRKHRNGYFDIDDIEGRPSRWLILENCVSPKDAEVFLRVRKKIVRSMHCPGERIEIDLRTLEQRVSELRDDAITELQSPLANRRPSSGIQPQPPGHVDDMARLNTARRRREGE